MNLAYLVSTILKMGALLAYILGLLWVLGRKEKWAKALGIFGAFIVIQLTLSLHFGDFEIFSGFDEGLLIQSCTMTMVALGLNLIYGFNGQFSLGQLGFYGIGAYCAADITFRWANGDCSGLLVAGIGVVLGGFALLGVGRLLKLKRGIPVLSAFTFYVIAAVAVGFIAVKAGNAIVPLLAPGFGTADAPGWLASPVVSQVIFLLSVIIAGIFAAEVSFLFGLPVLTLGSDYFGIATLGFAIVIQTLMVNSDTILPFPEMKGGRGMIGIPKMPILSWEAPAHQGSILGWVTSFTFSPMWLWSFVFLLLVIVVMRNLIHSSTGRAIISVREDETAAKAMGIDVARTKLLAFVAGSLFAGFGGAVYAHYIGFLSPGTFSFIAGFNPLIIVVFGGLGSMTGTIVASFGWIFFLEGFLRVLLGQMGPEAPTWRFVLYPIALILLMLLRPTGLLGSVEWGFLKTARIFRRSGSPPGGRTGGGAESPQTPEPAKS